ncbi:MAG: hypothetical protein WC655_29775 [Candidatus Hydrogenedentales bacterium]
MATPIDATIAQAMDQNFVDGQGTMRAQLLRATAGDAAVAEIVRNYAGQGYAVVGAHTVQTIEADRLAQQILQQRSAGGQPQAAGGPENVKPA